MNNKIFILLNKENNRYIDCERSISNLKLNYVDFGYEYPEKKYEYIISLSKDFNGYFNCVVLYELLNDLNISHINKLETKFLLKNNEEYLFLEHKHNNYFDFTCNIENEIHDTMSIDDWFMIIFDL